MDHIFIQCAAWDLSHEIIIVTTTSTERHPYITISGNLDDGSISCPGIELIIGSKSNVHYQSLLPLEVKVARSQLKASFPEDTIKLELITKRSYPEQNLPNLDLKSQDEFPDLCPPQKKQEVQVATPSLRREVQKSEKKQPKQN